MARPTSHPKETEEERKERFRKYQQTWRNKQEVKAKLNEYSKAYYQKLKELRDKQIKQ